MSCYFDHLGNLESNTDLTVGTINNDQIQNMDASLVLVFYCAEYFILLQQSGVRAIKWVI